MQLGPNSTCISCRQASYVCNIPISFRAHYNSKWQQHYTLLPEHRCHTLWKLFDGYTTEIQLAVPCLFVGWLLNVPAICECIGLDNFTCCHTEIEVADQTFHLTQSQYTDIGPASPSTDPITPGAWQGSTGEPIFKSLV